MAAAQQQINGPATGEVEHRLEVGFAHTAQQIGPIGQGAATAEFVGQHLFHRRQQFPNAAGRRWAGHLELDP